MLKPALGGRGGSRQRPGPLANLGPSHTSGVAAAQQQRVKPRTESKEGVSFE
jgi:hypothetical protein